MCQLCNLSPDIAKPDNAQLERRQFVELTVPIAEIGIGAPPSAPRVIGITVYTINYIKYMREHELRHAVGAVSGYVGNCYAAFFRRVEVDNVGAGRQDTDIPQLGEPVEYALIEHHLVCEHTIGILRSEDHLVLRRALVDRYLAVSTEHVPRQVAGIDGMTVHYHKFHLIKAMSYLYLSPQHDSIYWYSFSSLGLCWAIHSRSFVSASGRYCCSVKLPAKSWAYL